MHSVTYPIELLSTSKPVVRRTCWWDLLSSHRTKIYRPPNTSTGKGSHTSLDWVILDHLDFQEGKYSHPTGLDSMKHLDDTLAGPMIGGLSAFNGQHSLNKLQCRSY